MTSTLYRGGIVHSSTDPGAEAILVRDGVVAWLGATEASSDVAPAADEVVELDGALVAPGFVDAHAHVLETGLALTSVDLSPGAGVHSLPQALAAVERAATAARAAGQTGPLLGHGWDETDWPEGRAPSMFELDRAGDGAPVYLARVDVHSAVVSSSFAHVARLRDLPGWQPEGLVVGEAHHAAREAARDVPAGLRESLHRRALVHAAAKGIVSLHEQSAPSVDTRDGLRALLAMTADPASGLPHVAGYRAELCETADDARALLADIPGLTGIGGDLNVDGSLGSRTAALRERYADVSAAGRGTLQLTAERICNHLTAVTRARAHAAFHVIGDGAMEELLLGLHAASEVEGLDAIRAAGHRVEHAEMLDAPGLAQVLLFGLHLSVQPAFDATRGGDRGMYAARLGPGRAAGLNPFADLVGAGIPIAFGSDSPVTPFDPWGAIRAAAHHHQVEQRISAAAAFHAHTRGGWQAARAGRPGAGELRVGAPADLAIWRVEQLLEQRPGGTVPAWGATTGGVLPALPELAPGAADPVCVRTVRAGAVIYDAFG